MWRRLRASFLLLSLLVVVGTLGFRWIEGWTWLESIWMVAITLTTIGFGEIRPLSDTGRVFMIGFIVTGVGTAAYSLAQLTSYVADGGLVGDLRERRRRARMRDLKDHFIIVGLGRLGREVAADLIHDGHRVVAIDSDPAAAMEPLAGIAALIHGDATSDQVLVEAGIARAAGLAVATPNSAINVFVTLSARQLNKKLNILTRIDDRDAGLKAIRAGANGIVSPFTSGGARMASGLMHPQSAKFLEQLVDREYSDLSIADVQITNAKCVGRLQDLALRERFGVMVVAVRDPSGQETTIPLEIRKGDVAVVFGSGSSLAKFRAAATTE